MVSIPDVESSPEQGSAAAPADDRTTEAEKGIRRIEEQINFLQSLGSDVSAIKAALEDATEAAKSAPAEKTGELLKSTSDELEKALSDTVLQEQSRIEAQADLAKKLDVDLSSIAVIHDRMEASIGSKEHLKALQYSKMYRDNMDKLLSNKVAEAINEARALVRTAETLTDLSDTRELIRNAINFAQGKEFEKAYLSATSAKITVKKSLENEARKIFSFAMEDVKTLKSIGADLSAMDTMLSHANEAISKEDWKKLMEISDKILEEVEKLQPKIADDAFLAAKIAVVDIKKIGMDNRDLLELLRQAKHALDTGNHKNAVKFANDVRKECDKMMAVYRDATEVLSAVSALITEAKKANINVTKIIEKVLAVKRTFELRDFKKVIEQGNACRKELTSILKAKSAPAPEENAAQQAQPKAAEPAGTEKKSATAGDIREQLVQLESTAKRLRAMGSQLDQADELILKANEAAGAGMADEAAGFMDKASEMIKAEVTEMTLKVTADIESISGILPKDGNDVAEVKNTLRTAQSELGEGRPGRALSLLNECKDSSEKLVHKQIIEKLRHLDILLKDTAKTENEILGMTSQVMATASFQKFDYKGIVDFLESRKRKPKEEGSQEALMKHIIGIRKSIEDAKKLGVNVEEFKGTLKNVIDLVKKGNLDAATKSAIEIERKLGDVLGILRERRNSQASAELQKKQK